MLEKYGNNLTVSTDYKILKNCSVIFITTQTPSLPSGKFDLKYVESAMRQLHEASPECPTVVSSRTNIDDMQKLRKDIEKICCSPEFISKAQ